jgi:hypothetical protein
MILREENRTTGTENYPIATLSTTDITCTVLVLNPSNHLRQDTALGDSDQHELCVKIQFVPPSKHTLSLLLKKTT